MVAEREFGIFWLQADEFVPVEKQVNLKRELESAVELQLLFS